MAGLVAFLLDILRRVADLVQPYFKAALRRRLQRDSFKDDELAELRKLYNRMTNWTQDDLLKAEMIEQRSAVAMVRIITPKHVMGGETFYIVPELPLLVGRDDQEHGNGAKRLVLPDIDEVVTRKDKAIYNNVSRMHCKLVSHGKVVSVQDLDSHFGTFVNDGKLQRDESKALKSGDIIRVGGCKLRFQYV